MKKILILTSIYPGPDVPQSKTPVVHYFAKEWKLLGYDIQVIVNPSAFPNFYYNLPNAIMNLVRKKVGWELNKKRYQYKIEYEIDGINVLRLPIKKIVPHGKFSKHTLNKHVVEIEKYLADKNFKPDLIVGHWVNPQAYLEYKLKWLYGCKASLVLHDNIKVISKYSEAKQILNAIDVWGYRSNFLRDQFFQLYGIKSKFRCSSGISNNFFESIPERTWLKHNRFIYVGSLIQRKYPDIIIESIQSHYNELSNYSLDLYGEGIMKSDLENIIIDKTKISLKGRKSREELIKAYDKADVFIMISKNEVFGLVYLEAMARGCITIASRGEGMEGIIKDGVNGFLCNAGDKTDLIRVLDRIDNLSIEDKLKISQNAINTASKYTDKNVAIDYINNIIKYTDCFK